VHDEACRVTALRWSASRASLVVLALLVGGAPEAAAQGEPLEPGRVARLFVRGLVAPLEGTLLAVGPEQVRIDSPDGELAVPREQVIRTEVLGSSGNTVRGAVIGLGVGLATGIVLIVQSKDECETSFDGTCGIPSNPNEVALLSIPALSGAALGALIGSQIRSSRWVPGFFPVAAAPGPGLGMAWRVPLG